MSSVNAPVVSLTGGTLGSLLHARVDVPQYPTGNEVCDNFWPVAQGPITRRPPMVHVYKSTVGDVLVRPIPFIFNAEQSYLIYAYPSVFRFFIDNGEITIPEVSTSIPDGEFSSMGAWTDESVSPAAVSVLSGRLWLDSDGANQSIARREITVATVDQGKLHVIAFTVYHGPINISIGTTSGGYELLDKRKLGTGVHYMEWTPPAGTGTVYLDFWHDDNAGRAIEAVTILSGPSFGIPTPYTADILFDVHYAQQGDILTLTHGSTWTRRLIRRGHRSWSLEKLLPDDGPFNTLNTTNVTISTNALTGEVDLTASEPLFTDDDEGVLFSLTNQGQTQSETATSADTYTNGIRVTGINEETRTFTVTIEITGTLTVQLQASSGNENDYNAVSGHDAHTASQTFTYYDANDNQTWYYRLGVTEYTSGTATMTLAYSGGSGTGVIRVIYVNSSTSAYGEVLKTLASTFASKTWKRGAWSDAQGHPVSITRGYGRHWYGRGIKVWSTVSDDFTSFDAGDGKDDRAISVTIAAPSSDAIKWMSYLGNVIIGTSTAEYIGLPITNAQVVAPNNFQVIDKTYRGGTSMMPVNADGSVLFVDRTRRKLIQFVQNPKALSDTAYISVDLNELASELMWDGITSVAIQRTPEPRIFCVLGSGICRVLLFRRDIGDLGIAAWATIKTRGGAIEYVTVLPQGNEDIVYFMVRRTINGVEQRNLERLGVSVVINDEDLYHLDSALELNLERPDTRATASAATGTITIEAEDAVFSAGDVGKVVWIGGGQADITSYTSTTQVAATVRFPLTVLDEDGSPEPAASGRWGIGLEVDRVEGLDHLVGETVRIYGDMIDLGTATVDEVGGVDLPRDCSVVKVGKDVISRFKSLKLSYGAQKGTALTQNKSVKNLSLVLYRTGPTLNFGDSFATSDLKPVDTRSTEVLPGQPTPLYTGEWFGGQNGAIQADARQYYEVRGPAPATILAHVLDIDTRDR